jgi:hypothetical protein
VAERRAHVGTPALALAAIVVGGCGMTHAFAPTTPAKASAATADLELVQVSEAGGLMVAVPAGRAPSAGPVVHLRWHAREEGTGIARAFLVPSEAEPCTAGLSAELIDVDGQTRWDRPVGLGVEHTVTISFPGDRRLATGPLALDVEVAGARGTSCVRLSVAGGDRRFVTRSKLVLGGGLSVAAPLRADSTAVVRVDAVVGRWVGPVVVALRFGIGFDPRRLSYGTSEDNASSGGKGRFGELHLGPELKIFPYVHETRDHDTRAIGLSLSFEVGAAVSGAGTAVDPEHDDTFWGPRLGVILASLEPVPLGAPTHRTRGGRGLELALSRLSLKPGEPTRGAAWLLSAGVTSW